VLQRPDPGPVADRNRQMEWRENPGDYWLWYIVQYIIRVNKRYTLKRYDIAGWEGTWRQCTL
jgi:hypothetical protein